MKAKLGAYKVSGDSVGELKAKLLQMYLDEHPHANIVWAMDFVIKNMVITQ